MQWRCFRGFNCGGDSVAELDPWEFHGFSVLMFYCGTDECGLEYVCKSEL